MVFIMSWSWCGGWWLKWSFKRGCWVLLGRFGVLLFFGFFIFILVFGIRWKNLVLLIFFLWSFILIVFVIERGWICFCWFGLSGVLIGFDGRIMVVIYMIIFFCWWMDFSWVLVVVVGESNCINYCCGFVIGIGWGFIWFELVGVGLFFFDNESGWGRIL